MKNTFGHQVAVTLYGESHGHSVGVVIDGLAPGIPVDEQCIEQLLARRRPSGAISTARQEADHFVIESGVFEGKTTGTPVCIRIPNEDTRSSDYTARERLARPGHADIAARYKYHGYEDYRGGGHFSGRITAALVAAAGILLSALERKGIRIGTHIRRLDGVEDRDFADVAADLPLIGKEFPVLDASVAEEMKQRILAAKADGDSVGGVLETAVVGLPAGVGEPWFDTVEGVLSHALFSIPAVKAVAFGDGFDFVLGYGSTHNDAYRMENGEIITKTNHCGGIVGGMSTGMPVIFSCAFKPTPSIGSEQESVSLTRRENTVMVVKGRHDPCIVPRAVPVVEAAAALAIVDMMLD